mmetsp:Transcript_68807/g.108484  ORF Transcript_68807/g.108484 Transcript_68807/m.108484 type:complete len:239 (-) Transcript_68807:226-942(-)
MHAETIQQLGTKLTFLRVTAAHQDELGWVANADALTLHGVPATRCRVQQDVHQVVVQQIHLIHVQNPSVRFREQPGFESLLTLGQGLLDVNGTTNAVLCGAQRQINHGHLLVLQRQVFPSCLAISHLLAHDFLLLRRGVVGVIGDTGDLGQQIHQGSDCRSLASPTIAHDHDSTNLGINDVQDQGQLHFRLSHDGGEWIHGPLRGGLLLLRNGGALDPLVSTTVVPATAAQCDAGQSQ